MKSVFVLFTLVCAIICCVRAEDEEILVDVEIDRCYLPARTGTASCRADIASWYHDIDAGECKEFVYGGCGGNFNRFPTKKMCERACAHVFRGQSIKPISLENTKYNIITNIVDYRTIED